MLTHCYQQKKSNQFIDFIERVDSFYDLNIKRIFLVLDNAPIHKSKKTKEALFKHHPRITLVFLPTKSPKLNVIEVRWMATEKNPLIIVRSEINQKLD
ncbi:MAG: transposase [Candidatus Nitrosopolaris sp.]|jgi:transposase